MLIGMDLAWLTALTIQALSRLGLAQESWCVWQFFKLMLPYFLSCFNRQQVRFICSAVTLLRYKIHSCKRCSMVSFCTGARRLQDSFHVQRYEDLGSKKTLLGEGSFGTVIHCTSRMFGDIAVKICKVNACTVSTHFQALTTYCASRHNWRLSDKLTYLYFPRHDEQY